MDYSKIAELYDIYARTEIDIPFFIQESQAYTNVLELMSGTGRLSIPLLEAGIPLSCLDSSFEMLSVLKRKLQEKKLNPPVYEMDVCTLSLPDRYDLIIIPFNSFAEIVEPEKQQAALKAVYAHLTERGRLIITLHNPAVRLKGVDGQVRIRGRFPLANEEGTLILASVENFDEPACLVSGAQFYELYDPDGLLTSKRYFELQFYLHHREPFEKLVISQGFKVTALYGDYIRSEFDTENSPFMIWSLEKT